MKRAAPLALLLVTGLTACGSAAVNQRVAIVKLIRSDATAKHLSLVRVHDVRISKVDPQYAIAQEEFGGSAGPTGAIGADTWILHRSGSTWQPTSVENMFPDCGAAPPKVMKELSGSPACYPARGVYTSIYWRNGRTARLRYCQRPGGPGNFLAASTGVSCATASRVIYAVTHRCRAQASCMAGGFRCQNMGAHATCIDGDRRIAWDAG
jgi:hypothetical protein